MLNSSTFTVSGPHKSERIVVTVVVESCILSIAIMKRVGRAIKRSCPLLSVCITGISIMWRVLEGALFGQKFRSDSFVHIF